MDPATAPPVLPLEEAPAPPLPPEDDDDEEAPDEPQLVHVLHVHPPQLSGQQPAHDPYPHENEPGEQNCARRSEAAAREVLLLEEAAAPAGGAASPGPTLAPAARAESARSRRRAGGMATLAVRGVAWPD